MLKNHLENLSKKLNLTKLKSIKFVTYSVRKSAPMLKIQRNACNNAVRIVMAKTLSNHQPWHHQQVEALMVDLNQSSLKLIQMMLKLMMFVNCFVTNVVMTVKILNASMFALKSAFIIKKMVMFT